MSEPFLAEVRMVGFNFAPRGWAFCDGQILPINQNQSLYSLLGTTYGGDGRTSFALPDLRGRTPIHEGASNGTEHQLGQKGGSETHTLSVAEMPSHNHEFVVVNGPPTSRNPEGRLLSNSIPTLLLFNNSTPNNHLASTSVLNAGGGQAHENMQPYLAINFCIALQGLFPSRN